MSETAPNQDGPFHRFAWNGFGFDVPSEWNLASYHFGTSESNIELQDDFSVRLQFEWIHPRRPLRAIPLMERYQQACAKTGEHASDAESLTLEVPDWHAGRFVLGDKNQFVIAVYLSPDGMFFGILRLFFDKPGRLAPRRILDRITRSFCLVEGATIPWSVYDMDVVVGHEFRLVATTLQAGCKLMQFQWRLRRLMIWNVSMADWILRDKTPAGWAVGFLGSIRSLEGCGFEADGEMNIRCKRRGWRFPLGHYEDIGRACYRYRAWVRRLPDQNALQLLVYHYRFESDLMRLEGPLRDWIQAGRRDSNTR